MSFRIPATNNYFGLEPVSVGGANVNFQVNLYNVSSSEAADINPGDVVTMSTIATARKVAGAPYLATSSGVWLGVAANQVLAGAGSTAATIAVNTSQMLAVYDSAFQYFTVCDTTSGVLGSISLGKVIGICSTGVTGSTGPFQDGKVNAHSVMALSGVSATQSGAVKLISLDPIENGIYSTTAAASATTAAGVRKWIVMPVFAYAGPSTNAVVNTTS